MNRLLLLSVFTLAACGEGTPNAIKIARTCQADEVNVEVEVGLMDDYYGNDCPKVVADIKFYRGELEARFKHFDLDGWTVRIRSTTIVHKGPGTPPPGHIGGETYHGPQVIDVLGPFYLPHEMGHVAFGSGHRNWSCTFGLWSINTLGFNQQDYLGECIPTFDDPWADR